jgi:rubrerythrin
MVTYLNKHKRIIFTVTVIVFVVGIFFGLGAYIGGVTLKNTVAKVGNVRIPYDRYEINVRNVYDNFMRKNEKLEDNKVIENMIRQEVFKDMIVSEILYQEAKKLKMGVSDYEVAMEVLNTQSFYDNGKFNPALYVRTIWSRYRMTPKEYEEWRKKERTVINFKNFIYTTVKVCDDDINFYKELMDKKDIPKNNKEFMERIRQEKFLDVANYYLRELTTRIEIKDYRKNFELDRSNS